MHARRFLGLRLDGELPFNCGPQLVSKIGDMYGKLDSGKFDAKDWYNSGDPFKTADAQLCKTLDHCMKDNPGQVINFVAHSKGSSVVERWSKNHPEFTGQARLYKNPDIDVTGSEKFKDYLNQARQKISTRRPFGVQAG